MIKKRCNSCVNYEVLHTLCDKCKELNEFDSLMSGAAVELPRVDMGASVSVPEREALWPADARIDVIGQNGPTGEHYGRTHGIEKVCKSVLGKL